MKIRNSLTLSLLAGLTLGWHQFAAAQELPHTPTSPNLLGMYPGMPQLAAKTQMQKQSNTEQARLTTNGYPSLSLNLNGKNPVQYIAYLTEDPDNPTIWMVQQTQHFEDGNPMSQQALMSALR